MTGARLHGLCSLDALAYQAGVDSELLVATDARRKEVYWAAYVDGERVGGPAVAAPGDVPVAGTVKGDDISFSDTIDYNGNAVTLSFTGKIKGDAISGTVFFNESASDEWSAKRAAAAKPKTE